MVMEPMSEESVGIREGQEMEKFRVGIRGRVAGLGKRKREDEKGPQDGKVENGAGRPAAKKKAKGPKGPNPLSVKKPKKDEVKAKVQIDAEGQRAKGPEPLHEAEDRADDSADAVEGVESDGAHPSKRKKKRRRKPKQSEVLAATDADADGQSGDSA